jgi:DNA-binding transcriptional MerR regulator
MDKKYLSISEVSVLCNIKSHTLRFWEREFEQLQPVTRKGSRRYYQSKDIELIKQIQSLLYEEGMTITGAKKSLQSSKKQFSGDGKEQKLVKELEDLLAKIK